jgi:hypothetical protein
MKKLSLILVLVTSLLLLAGGAFAQTTDTAILTINATVASRADLTLEVGAINFPDRDPETVLSIPADENTVDVRVKVRTGSASAVTLTHQAAGPLSNGTDTIPISNVTWTAAGDAGFVGGTMSSAAPVTAGSWTGSGNRSGTFSYFLANSWDYALGSYTVSSTYTLTIP